MPQAQGALAQILTQMEPSFKTAAATVQSRKCLFTRESLKFSQELAESQIIRGSSRHPSQGILGNVDVGGGISSELMVDHFFWAAALGSVEVTETGGTLGSDVAPTAGTISAIAQQFTLTKTAHGLVLGDSIKIEGLTAPTALNSLVCPVISVPDADHFVLWIPMGVSTTYTKGSGTFKKVTGTSVFTYTYKAGGKLPSYTIEKGYPDIAQFFKYMGCVMSNFSFTVPKQGLCEMNSTWMGGSETTGQTSFETGTAIDNGKALMDSFKLAAADVKEGGSATAIITEISNFTLDNKLDGDTFVLGGAGVRSAINPGVYQITGQLTAMFMDMTLYTKAKNQTESSIDLTFKRGTGAGTLGNESLQIVVPELTFTPSAPETTSAGIVMAMGFKGFYDNGADATAFKVIIKSPKAPGQVI